MKLIFTPVRKYALRCFLFAIIQLFTFQHVAAQVCLNPADVIYGLTGSGNIYPITVSTTIVGTVLNNPYTGNAPSSSNGLGYNPVNSKFYYFKRNPDQSSQEFVSFDPLTKIVTILADCPSSKTIHTGCLSFNGVGYYTIDVDGYMYYYDILANSWKQITSTIKDQFGNNVSNIISGGLTTGDIAIDGSGNLWIVACSNTVYGLYKISAPLPTNPVSSLTASQWIAPSTSTPAGNGFAGIAFNATGQILLATRSGDNKLYRLEDNKSLTYLGTMNMDDVGNDLTSCNFPAAILAVTWQSFTATLKNSNAVLFTWVATQDINNRGYYIEHSLDGATWKDIGFVKNSGNNGSSVKYMFTHANQADLKNYYRIRQVDNNGAVTYSPVRSVSLKTNIGVAIWPNPTKDFIRIQSENINGHYASKVFLYDQSGRLIKENILHPGMNMVPLKNIPAGTYLVRAEFTSGETSTLKIIKQ